MTLFVDEDYTFGGSGISDVQAKWSQRNEER